MGVVKEFEAAFNRQDVGALVGLFTESATYADSFYGEIRVRFEHCVNQLPVHRLRCRRSCTGRWTSGCRFNGKACSNIMFRAKFTSFSSFFCTSRRRPQLHRNRI